MTPPADPKRYKYHRFPGDIISHGVWLSYRFPLSYRDVQELLCERGIDVTHFNDLLFDRRRLSWVARVEEEGTTSTRLLAPAVPLLALPCLAMADNICAVTVGTMQDLQDHEVTQSSWGC
jgi:hypothetical protein